jgi:hypothetical protein
MQKKFEDGKKPGVIQEIETNNVKFIDSELSNSGSVFNASEGQINHESP